MNRPLKSVSDDALQLSAEDRLRLIEKLWDSLEDGIDRAAGSLPEWHKAELEARIAAHDRHPSAALPWDEVKADIVAALRK